MVWISHIERRPDFASGCDEEFLVRISVKTDQKRANSKSNISPDPTRLRVTENQRQTLYIVVNHERSKQMTLKDAEVEFRVAPLFFFEQHGEKNPASLSSIFHLQPR